MRISERQGASLESLARRFRDGDALSFEELERLASNGELVGLHSYEVEGIRELVRLGPQAAIVEG